MEFNIKKDMAFNTERNVEFNIGHCRLFNTMGYCKEFNIGNIRGST